MTIEEYLKSAVTYAKNAMIGNYDTEGLSFYEGYKEAMEDVLEQLPKLDHDVTLKEVKEYCRKHKYCEGCNFALKHSTQWGCCELDSYPFVSLAIPEVERRMKEEKN